MKMETEFNLSKFIKHENRRKSGNLCIRVGKVKEFIKRLKFMFGDKLISDNIDKLAGDKLV